MKRVTLVAVFHVGHQNLTRVTGVQPLEEGTLSRFARSVARKRPGAYYVFEVSGKMQKRKGDSLYEWHVGDGFTHAEGWWTNE